MGTSSNDDLSGYLHIKVKSSPGQKIKSGKKWFVINKQSNYLQSYKSPKDVGDRALDILPLFGAEVSFGHVDENEFIINIRGTEYFLSAENHRTMMKWMNVLQDQVKLKSVADSRYEPSLEMVSEDEPLELKEERIIVEQKPKRQSFFQRLFGRGFRFRSNKKGASSDAANEEKRTVEAAPLRSVVGSMQDITSSGKTLTCKNCKLLETRNTYLTEQVRKLNDEVIHTKDEMQVTGLKNNILENQNITLKKDFMEYLLKTLLDDDEYYSCLNEVPCYSLIADLLTTEKENNNNMPSICSKGFNEPHKDYLGFIHGNNGNNPPPTQVILYICDMLRRRYAKFLQGTDDIYLQWQRFSSTLSSQPNIEDNSVLKELIAHGIPHEFRSSVWKWLIYQHVRPMRERKGEDYYSKLVETLPNLQGMEDDDFDSPIEKQIKIDLLRTMPTHEDYQHLEQGKVPILHRVLRAYLIHNPEVGYCQGMNFMVGFALLYLDEESCFWLLVTITELFFSPNHYNLYLSGTQANQRVFQEICQKEIPFVVKHLDDKNCELSPITFNWFMTIFIDSLTIEVVLNIWDCFLVYGHTILYKFALCVLKAQEKDILRGKDSLSIMRSLKKFGKKFFDAEGLLKDVFSTTLSDPMESYVTAYHSHVDDIQEDCNRRKKEDDEYEKEKQKLEIFMKVSSETNRLDDDVEIPKEVLHLFYNIPNIKFTPKTMMVSVSDNLDELDDDLIIKCSQCEENRNFVWLLCSSDLVGQIFVLNVSSRKIIPLSWQVDTRCIAMERIPKLNVMLVSTMKSQVHAIDVETRVELWKIQLAGSALSITSGPSGNIALSLIDGSVAFINVQEKEKCRSVPTYIDISRSPVFCGCMVDHLYWCGAANKIIVLNLKTLESAARLQVCPNDRHVVNKLVASEYGVWNTLEHGSVVHLWHKTKYHCLMTVDVLDACGLGHEKKIPNTNSTTITTMMILKDKFWVGFANGRFVIYDICKERENTEEDIEQAFNIYKNSVENLTVIEHADSSGMRKSVSRIGISACCHENDVDSEDSANFVVVDKMLSRKTDDGLTMSLQMSQIQRVCEESVTCFIPCRNDNKLVLSCMGALNDDSSVILWSSENQNGKQMWFAQTVSYSE